MRTKEQNRLRNKAYHAAHKQDISKRKKQWAIDNPEKVNKFQRENPELHREYSKEYRKKHPEKFARYARKRNYGVTQSWYEEKLKEQDNKCSICQRSFCESLKPVIDHNHETDEVRDLLCRSCNWMLGCAYEDSNRLEKAAKYLK